MSTSDINEAVDAFADTPADADEPGHRTLSDQAYARLRHDVIQGAFAPGTKLGIGQLRSTYAVGATPLREALHRLGAEGFVVMEGQRGFRVADISERELRELTELRVVIEGLALRESMERADDEWEARVVVAFHRLQKIEQQPEPDPLLWEARNSEFHLALISQCDSSWLMRIYELLYDQHKRYRVIARLDPGGERDIHGEHIAMKDAALARDVPALLACHEAHIRNTQRTLQRVLGFEALS